MRRVLVTGSSGWLGRALAQSLVQAGETVRGFDLAAPDFAGGPSFESLTGDLRRPEDAARLCRDGADVLFHCAGVIHPRRTREFEEINVRATVDLLEAAAAAGVTRAVIMSSNSVCGCNADPARLFDEDSPYQPSLGYGLSKRRMEEEARRFQGRLEVVLIRAPWFYGPGQPARQTLFFTMIREGRAPVVGSGENLRSMAYIDNLCEGLRLAAATPAASGRTYWIADARPYRWNEILDTVADVLQKDFGLSVKPGRLRLPRVASSLALAADRAIQAAGFYHQKIHVLSECDKNIACSIARARAELGYAPRVELREGMRRSIDWCLRQGQRL